MRDDSDEMPTGQDLIERLQRTLGIAIVVESVESVADAAASPADSDQPDGPFGSREPFTIRASFMYGPNSTQVVVGGPTESDAWAALAREAIAWRNSDFQHVQMWPGGG
jgi:hypothetical protein